MYQYPHKLSQIPDDNFSSLLGGSYRSFAYLNRLPSYDTVWIRILFPVKHFCEMMQLFHDTSSFGEGSLLVCGNFSALFHAFRLDIIDGSHAAANLNIALHPEQGARQIGRTL